LKTEDFRIVIDEVDRMNRLLTDLLVFQQPRPPRTGPAAMRPLLTECSELVRPEAEKRKVSIILAKCEETSVAVDEQYFKQVMMNLLLNALEVSAAGDRVEVRASVSDGMAEIQVSDQGPGLDAKQQEHLFEPFYTTKANGHGLGLAVSRELAQSMGGDLSYRPGAHGGAVFVLSLKGVANGS
jgi:signal transduction histidine kinase